MKGRPAAHADADRGDLGGVDPDAREPAAPIGGDAEIPAHPDQHLFQRVHVPVHVTAAVAQRQQRIGHQLPRPVEGGAAAAADAERRHAQPAVGAEQIGAIGAERPKVYTGSCSSNSR